MIRLCESFNELDFLPSNAFSARITALFETYGAGCDFALFWVQTVENIPVAALSKVDGCITLCHTKDADIDELRDFIGFCGCTELVCEKSVLDSLGFSAEDSSVIVRFEKGRENIPLPENENAEIKDIYELLLRCGFNLGAFGAFASDVCARLNKGTAKSVSISEDGKPCACAFALFVGQKSVLLGAVGTSPEMRGRGYASRLVEALAGFYSDKDVFLFCRNDSLVDFYGKFGFSPCGRWAVASFNN